LLSPLGSLAIIGAMLVAIATVSPEQGFWVSKGGYEFNSPFIGAAAALAITGPGAYSLDSALRIHLPEPVTLSGPHHSGDRRRGVTLGRLAPRWSKQSHRQLRPAKKPSRPGSGLWLSSPPSF